MRVLHCPEIVGGNAQQLARSERELGLESRAVVFRQNYLNYETDRALLPANGPRWKVELVRWKLFWSALSCDVVHYNSGQTIMPAAVHFRDSRLKKLPLPIRLLLHAYTHALELLDMRLLKMLGKGIVITFQGDDARQGEYCRKHFRVTFAGEVEEGYYSPASDEMKRRRIGKIAALADRIHAVNPDLLHVLPPSARFLPYGHIDLREWPVDTTAKSGDRPVILHAPSHKGVKGTRFILAALDRLKAEGIPFDFVLVEGMSREEARKQYERADLLVDQLLAGWYGGLAVELMALGKPVICYIRDEDLQYIPEEMAEEIPVIRADPDTICEVLRHHLTEARENLREIGMKGRRYAEKWHDPSKIAAHLKQEYEEIMEGRS